MKTSSNGITFIKNWESFSAKAYEDGKSGNTTLYSIGYGHQIKKGESYLLNTQISQAQALELLKNDLPYFEQLVNNRLTKTPSQAQFDALVSYVYGTGVKSKTVFDLINKGASNKEIFDFWTQHWITQNGNPLRGLIRRRWMEADIYCNGYNLDALKGSAANGYAVKNTDFRPIYNGSSSSTKDLPDVPEENTEGDKSNTTLIIALSLAIIGLGILLSATNGSPNSTTQNKFINP